MIFLSKIAHIYYRDVILNPPAIPVQIDYPNAFEVYRLFLLRFGLPSFGINSIGLNAVCFSVR